MEISSPTGFRRPRVGWYAVTGTQEARADAATTGTLAKAADENFPVAPFFLPRAWRDDLMAVYGFARLVDDIGDGDLPPGGADARLLGLESDSKRTGRPCWTPSKPT